jgi:hypothetical protein
MGVTRAKRLKGGDYLAQCFLLKWEDGVIALTVHVSSSSLVSWEVIITKVSHKKAGDSIKYPSLFDVESEGYGAKVKVF